MILSIACVGISAQAAPDDDGPRSRQRADLVAPAGNPNQARVRAEAAPAVPVADRVWLDAALTPRSRAQALLDQMTLEEKVDLMTSDVGPYAYYNAPIPRLGIPALKMADGTAGIGARGWTVPGTGDTATAMPSGMALASTFSASVAKTFAGLVTDEAKRTGHNMLLGPNADIIRQPWWGRESETMSEDPLLTSRITTPYVREVQSQNVIADMKHYAIYNQETNRANGQNSIVSERAAHEVHLAPFESAVKNADLGSVMCSFNKIGGTFACESPQALQEWLRDDLGFKGFVITDFGAAHSTVGSIEAGTDMETGTQAFYGQKLIDAVNAGEVDVALVDKAVLRVLTVMLDVGLFDNDYEVTPLPVTSHGATARKVEEQAITLLKNTNSQLPLSASSLGSIAVIGGDANIATAQSGAPYVKPTYSVSPLDGIRKIAAASDVEVNYSPGTDPLNGASMLGGFAAVPSSVLSPDSGTGDGLTAQFWTTTDMSGEPTVTRVERQVNYDVALLSASDGLRSSQVEPPPAANTQTGGSAIYTGSITPPASGTYRFSLSGWGSATMSLAGNTVIDMTGQGGYRTVTSDPITLTAGASYPVRVEYRADQPLGTIDQGALKLGWSHPTDAVSPAITAAAEVARSSTAAVVVVGDYESEQRDRDDLVLPNEQDQLIAAVRAANPRTVVVLQTGGPVLMPWLSSVRSVVQTYFGGQEVGNALARILFGKVSPSGRLPITYPKKVADVPVPSPLAGINNPDVTYDEGVFVGYRAYKQLGRAPQFAFGHGLTYTTFAYSGLSLETDDAGRIVATFSVENTGDRTGTEVPQVYVGALPTSVSTPPRSLAGWSKVTLTPGQTKQVTVTIDRRQFSYWDSAQDRWVTPDGNLRVYAGASATKTPLSARVAVD
ncbi:MAG: glycoside hydrolase family 3 C-terminal domain-containing protein [Aeromicrobium sp.]